MRFALGMPLYALRAPMILLSGVLLCAAGTPMSVFNNRSFPYKETPATRPAQRTAFAGKAQAMFESRCVRCHDEDGTGRTFRPTMPALPDFTSAHWHQQHSDAELVAAIVNGRGTQMPAFADRITAAEARGLVEHVRTLAGLAGPGKPAPAESDFYERFRELQEEFERLQKQLDELRARDKP
jgi:mono/diheme cytochrome c family protein